MSANTLVLDRVLLAILLKASGGQFELIRIRNEYTNLIPECARPSKKDLWWYVYMQMEELRRHGLVSTSKRSGSCEGKTYKVSEHFGEYPMSIVPEPFIQPVQTRLEMKRIEDLKYKIEIYRRATLMLKASIEETQVIAAEMPPLAASLEKKEVLLKDKELELFGRIGAIRAILDDLIDT
jgi:hypothetical protein